MTERNKNLYLRKLANLANADDPEEAHIEADEILCDILFELGLTDIIGAWEKVPKWYA